MSEFTSEPSQAAQEEVEQIGATPEQPDPLVKDPSARVSGDDPITDSQLDIDK